MHSNALLATCCASLLFVAGCGDASLAPVDPKNPAIDASDSAQTDGPAEDVSQGDNVVEATAETALEEQPPQEAGPAPDKSFDRFCKGKPWNATLKETTVGKLSGSYKGVLKGPDPDNPETPFDPGTLEMMKVIPQEPVQVTALRANFLGTGKARLRLTSTLGRSYPGFWPDLTDLSKDLLPPIDIDIKDGKADQWTEIDITDKGVFLLPTQHYMILYEHLEGTPYLGVEDLPAGEYTRALLILPNEYEPYGLGEYNYRLELKGNAFCSWSAQERWFELSTGQAFADPPSARVAVADLNGDGHLDVITNTGDPQLFLGNGKGAFSQPATDLFSEAKSSSMLVFGDLDNDGDQDAFGARYVSIDGDGDKFEVGGTPPDCNDADPKVNPKATEVANGYDDDCDGKADDGTDTSDKDADGVSVASGDCDDTRKDVYPNAPELLDSRDNDCDLLVDEDFVNVILLNDGTGKLTVLPSSGVEFLDPTTAAGFADGNGDGKLDLYYGNWLKHYPDNPSVQDRYFEGAGDGKMLDKLAAAGLVLKVPYSCYGVNWNDFNNDGWPDIFVGNYHLYPNQLWKNQGNGTYSNVAEDVGVAYDDIPPTTPTILIGGHTYGSDWGDIDNDGDLDAYITNLAHPRNYPWGDPSMFVINQGPPDYAFVNKREEYGFVYDEGDVNVAFGDFDNDADLDVAIASLYTGHYSRVYRNEGPAGFVDVTYETQTAVHDCVSVVWADVDEDGDLDLLFADRAEAPYVHLFLNRLGNQSNWVELDLQGVKTNRDAVGARVTLTSGGVTQTRIVSGGGGQSNVQAPHTLHFGLGSNTAIDSVSVRWVGGSTESISGVQSNKRQVIVEGTGTATTK